MTQEPDKQYLIAGRVENVPQPTAGSMQVTARCGCRVWISQHALSLLVSRPGVVTMCVECAPWDDCTEAMPVPGALEDVAAWLRQHGGQP